MLTSEVMFELGLRRAQSFDLLIGEGKKRKEIDQKKDFFFREEIRLF